MRTPPIIKDGESVEVCAWCYPGITVLLDYPCLKHIPLNHGLCKAHLAGFEAEMGQKLARKAQVMQSCGSMHYAILIALLLLASITAADTTDIEDLGVITENVAIGLDASKDRKDFNHFILEFLPQQWPTNKVTVTTTNSIVTLEELTAVPHGPAVLGVRSVHQDGSESPIKLFKLDIRRDAPGPPSARRVFMARPKFTNSLEGVFHSRQQRALTNEMPLLPGQTNKPAASAGQPLPNGSPKTYSQHTDEMRAFYASRQGQRRNQ